MSKPTKTSVYLDSQQKRDLEEVASLTGRSQADLIRDGINQVIHDHLAKRPPMKAWSSGPSVLQQADRLMEDFGR